MYPKWNEKDFYILGYLQGICVHLQFDAAMCTSKADFKGFPSDPLLVSGYCVTFTLIVIFLTAMKNSKDIRNNCTLNKKGTQE